MTTTALESMSSSVLEGVAASFPQLASELVAREQASELLYEASKTDDLPAAFIAIQKGADPNARHDIRLETPLHVATYSGYKDMVLFLLEVGSDINCQTKLGRTPLHLATVSLRPQVRMELVEVLISRGADHTIKDTEGKTARDYVLEAGQLELLNVLDAKSTNPSAMPSFISIQKRCSSLVDGDMACVARSV